MNFSGYGEIADYKEKIDEYLHLGYKDIVGKDGEVNLKILSVLLFVFGLGWFASFADIIPSMLKHSGAMVVFLPISLFIIASFVCDIILIVDKIRDNKYRGYDGQN